VWLRLFSLFPTQQTTPSHQSNHHFAGLST
jgi:hypothetical protein